MSAEKCIICGKSGTSTARCCQQKQRDREARLDWLEKEIESGTKRLRALRKEKKNLEKNINEKA